MNAPNKSDKEGEGLLKVGLSTNGIEHDERLFEGLSRAGIFDVEISRSYQDETENIDYKKLKELSEAFGINLWSFHLPFAHDVSLCIESLNKEVRDFSLRFLSEHIKRAAGIGIDKIVIHGSSEPIKDGERAEKLKLSKDSLYYLADVAFKHGAVVAVENLPRTCLGNDSYELAEMIAVHDNLKVCFDVNHLLKEDHEAFVKNLGNKIITTHISDYDFVDERHWLPGEGDIDWNCLYSLLKSIDYGGVFLYEVPFTINTLVRERPLVFDDYLKNAKEIFLGEKITTLKSERKNG